MNMGHPVGHWDLALYVSGMNLWAMDSKGRKNGVTMGLARSVCTKILYWSVYCLKFNFLRNPLIRLLVGWLFLKGREVKLPLSYRSTFLYLTFVLLCLFVFLYEYLIMLTYVNTFQ